MAVLAVDPLVLQGIGLLGMILSNCLGFSNLPAMLEARRRGTLGDINPVVPPILCGNCFAWCMYATAKQVRGSPAWPATASLISRALAHAEPRRAADLLRLLFFCLVPSCWPLMLIFRPLRASVVAGRVHVLW